MAVRGHDAEVSSSNPVEPWSVKLRSPRQWSAAASSTMSDLKMLRRELVIGYVVAGFLTVVVPTHVWSDVFLHGHGVWTSLENVLVGPFVAIISFVCSIGNVPLAATLWTGGISFGGVISFLFADLITFPLLLVYRKQYGTRVALRLLIWFWATMAVAGLAVEGVARAVGLVPTHRPTVIASTSFQWNYTTYLNIVFVVVFAVLYLLYRNRDKLGVSATFATDPVCGMQVQRSTAPARATLYGESFFFCSQRCRDSFTAGSPDENVRPAELSQPS
jgi:YHS domain-containing protein